MYADRRERIFNILQIAGLLALQGGCWLGIGLVIGWSIWGI